MPAITLDTPIGPLTVTERDGAIARVDWGRSPAGAPTPLLTEAARQLEAYFAGNLQDFDLPLAPARDDRQHRITAAMQAIPYGATRTYGELAKETGLLPNEVGQGCAANPIPVIIPCHRVLSATGLGGYSGAGGVETKIALLKLEGGYPMLL